MLPRSELAWSNLGTSLVAARNFNDAIAAFQRAIALAPDNAELHYNLGNALLAAGDPVAAEAAFLRALALAPAHIGAITNLGTAMKDQGRLAEAETLLRGAIAMAPDNADLRFNLALTLLIAGKFTEGWQAYEARRALPGFAIKPQTLPPWDGSPLAGRRLLVHAEQGIGDTLQFSRYLGRLAESNSTFVFEVSERLHPLLRSLPGKVTLTPRASRSHGCDVEAPLLSLPFLIGPAEPFWPDDGPYLSADPERRAHWEKIVKASDEIAIAISWQGNPNYRNDAARSVPLAAFEPLARMPGVRLVSLQQGPGTEQIAELPWRGRLLHLGEEIDRDGAFLDSAAIASAVDLVVTSDTALAHLAGALGVPTRLALSHAPDWRWGAEGEDCPWYPSMRLFRQSAPGDWHGVFEKIANTVAETDR
jgi:tetratricopeptide (TPR) repeat protein